MVGPERTPFEIIRASRPERGGMEAPSWWSSRPTGNRRGGPVGWLTQPIHLRISRLAVAVVLVVLAAGFGLAYELGTRSPNDIAGQRADQRSAELMSQMLASPVNRSLLQRGGVDEVSGEEGGDRAGHPPPGKPVQAMRAEDRVAGLNYYCVMTLGSARRENAEEVAAFLRRNHVPADVVETRKRNGSGLVRVFALRGFERKSSAAAEDFRKKLTHLGRAWKAGGGASDWHDTFLVKYRGD